MAVKSQVDGLLSTLPGGIGHMADPTVLSTYATDESGRAGKAPLAMVRPKSARQVQAVVRWAAGRGVTLIPLSSPGGPRRRGDTVSDQDAVILDLSGMNRVLHVDGRDAVALIEPGVTFAALDDILRPHGLRGFLPLAPRASKSVVSAFLEREPITVPGKHWDVADPLASLELVFGTGELFRTGSAGIPGKLEDNLARGNRNLIAPGPSFTDFGRVVQGAQGALAVVTWASILCQRIPAVEVPFFAAAAQAGPVIELCYRMLRRRPAGQMFILNHVQLALLLADDAASYAALKASLPRWILYVELAATPYFPEEAIAYQRADLERDAEALGVAITEALAGRPAATLPRRQRTFTDTPAHHRVGQACQEVFALTQLDAVPAQLQAVAALEAPGDVAVYLQPLVQGVNVHCQFTMLDQPGQEAALSRLAVTVALTQAAHRGFLSRPYHPWAHVPFARDPGIRPLLEKTKALFDPGHVLQAGAMSLGGVR